MQCGTAVGWGVAGTDLHVQLYRLYTAQEEPLPEIHPTLHYELRALAQTAVCSSRGKGWTHVSFADTLSYSIGWLEHPPLWLRRKKGRKFRGAKQ